VTQIRRIVLAGPPNDNAPAVEGVVRIVLDTAWSASNGGRSDLVGLRDLLAPVLDRRDLFEESFELLDDWAEAVAIADRMTVDGLSWWFRGRLWIWLWLVARVHWAAVLEVIFERFGVPAEIEVGPGEPVLAEVVERVVAIHGSQVVLSLPRTEPAETSIDEVTQAAPALSLVERVQWRLGRHPRQLRKAELDRRNSLLDARVAALALTGVGRVLVVTNPAVHQVVTSGGADRRQDPFLGSVVDRLRGTDIAPILLMLGTDQRDDSDWAILGPDPASIPDRLLSTRWSDPADREIMAAAGTILDTRLAMAPDVRLGVGAIDFGQAIIAELRQQAAAGIPSRIRRAHRAARMLRELAIGCILLVNEYGQTEWIAAARIAGIPILAVQHGIIVPQHVGYRHRRHPALPLPTRTFVFGAYEAHVLSEHGGYRSDEVVVTGAPRLDSLMPGAPGGASAAVGAALAGEERAAIHERLGVRPGDRMVVISTTREAVHRRFYWPHALARLLDGPLPATHLVFKLHPAEGDDGTYRELVEGLARAGGREAPPVSVVRDIDLFALLRAADAHLGLYSTVLTDAVVAGTPNLIAETQARVDLLGYVAAGVALPVHDHSGFRSALDELAPPDPTARRAFLDDHFRPGDATGRIVAEIRRALDGAQPLRSSASGDGAGSPAAAAARTGLAGRAGAAGGEGVR
jgi:hypothetical protein